MTFQIGNKLRKGLKPKNAFKKGHIPWLKGKKGIYSKDVLKQMCLSQKLRMADKTKHPRWKKDRTQLAKRQERNDMAYKEWRMIVWKRDSFKCKISNQDCKGRLEAHHILGWKEFTELRYDINNGITLCHFHHPRKRNDEKKLSPYFQKLVAEVK